MSSLDRPVSDLMQRDVVTLQRADRLDLAEDIMRLGRIRHMPVIDGERVVGILTHRDLLAASLSTAFDFDTSSRRAFTRSIDVGEVMATEVETIAPEDNAQQAGERMLKRQIGCLPVVDKNGGLLGLVTETDLLKAALGHAPEGEVVEVGFREASPFDEEMGQLRRLRDEFRLQIHLGKREATELWEKLEHRFGEAEARAKNLVDRVEEPVEDVAEAMRLLIDEIRTGYGKLRGLL